MSGSDAFYIWPRKGKAKVAMGLEIPCLKTHSCQTGLVHSGSISGSPRVKRATAFRTLQRSATCPSSCRPKGRLAGLVDQESGGPRSAHRTLQPRGATFSKFIDRQCVFKCTCQTYAHTLPYPTEIMSTHFLLLTRKTNHSLFILHLLVNMPI